MKDSGPLQIALEHAVRSSASPGAVAYVGDIENTYFRGATGSRQLDPQREPVTIDTIYDLASLTKVVGTTSVAMRLHEKGVFDLDQPVVEFLPIPAFNGITFRHLLTHTAGLAPYFAYYREHSSMTEMIQHFALSAVREEPGRRRVYSDPGFMILGYTLEMAGKAPLDDLVQREICEPLGMESTRYNPPQDWRDRCAATERCEWRNYLVRGQVHDENAFAVGGVSGHAGLFSTADDLAIFCRALLSGKVVSEKTLKEMTNLHQVPSYPWQGLGWLLSPWSTDAQGSLPARFALGHTGWTGTTIWADRESGLFAILLGNTCHPSRRGRNNRRFRQTFYEAVSTTFFANRCAAHTGLDNVLRQEFEPLGEQRFGLLTNSAAVDMIKRPILDVMQFDRQQRLGALFSPEHGLLGQAEAGEKVGNQNLDRVPVVSLYGNRTAPTRDELDAIDLFVVDLPDVGARYYTYMATMKNSLEACAAAGKPVLVLDRPNPLGGVILEGPIAERTGSLVCCAPIPVRHGMTMGELALYFAERMNPKPRVEVVPVEGWPRHIQFENCALPWVPPSPNMPRPETALVYIGTCLFEGTNLNEGRGTESPFQLIGAPWVDGERVIAAMSEEAKRGFKLSPTYYKPKSIPGKASSPRFQDQTCGGVYIQVEDAQLCRPFHMALEMISALRKTHGPHFAFTDFFDTLAGGGTMRAQLESDANVGALVESWNGELDAFARQRPKLYV